MILKEQKFTNPECDDMDCAVKIGKILSVDMVAAGSVNKTGKFTITLKFIDVKKGTLVYADSEIAQIENVIENAINILAKRSAKMITDGKLAEEAIPAEDKKPVKEEKAESSNNMNTGYYLRGIMPGWGQLYAGEQTKGIVFMSGFITAGLASGYLIYDYIDKRKEYDNLDPSNTQREYRDRSDQCETAANRVNITSGILVGIYLLNWIDILFFSRPEIAKTPVSTYNATPVRLEILSMNRVQKEQGMKACISLRF